MKTLLKHTVSTTIEDKKIIVKIELGDPCRNGHQDFSITGDIFVKGRWEGGGCVHDEILKYFPELKPFVDLHLCDYLGAPMYAIANGLYHIENKTEYAQTYLRLTDHEFYEAQNARTQTELALILEKHQVPARWKKEADTAIKMLEEMTGEKFEVNSTRSNYTPPTPEEIADFKEKEASGYFTSEQVKARDEAKAIEEIKRAIEKQEEKAKERVDKIITEKNLFVAALKSGLPPKRIHDLIYYTHSNELVFNWNKKVIPDELVNTIIQNLKSYDLPKGITIKNGK